jgi:hypothetical protein
VSTADWLGYGFVALVLLGLTVIGVLNQRAVDRRRIEREGCCGDSDGRTYGARDRRPQ